MMNKKMVERLDNLIKTKFPAPKDKMTVESWVYMEAYRDCAEEYVKPLVETLKEMDNSECDPSCSCTCMIRARETLKRLGFKDG